MLSLEEFEAKKAKDAAFRAQVVQEQADLISRFDQTAGKILAGLDGLIVDLDAMGKIRDEVYALPKEAALIVKDEAQMKVVNLATLRGQIENARAQFLAHQQ